MIIHFGLKGSEGRIVNVLETDASATADELLAYRDSKEQDNDKIQDECCWGIAYQIHKYIWENEVKEQIVNKFCEGYQEKRITLYPRVCKSNTIVFFMYYNPSLLNSIPIRGRHFCL